MTVRFRPELDAIPAYRAGAAPAARADAVETFKVSSNENPFPPLPHVAAVIEQAARTVNRYPDPTSQRLREAIADHAHVAVDQVGVATGAVALCYQFAHATVGPGDEVMFGWRSFEAYPILTQVAGAKAQAIPLRPDATYDLETMAAAVTEQTRLIFVCSPNNPTGTIVTQTDLRAFLRRVPANVLVVLDEAYIEFCRDPRAADGLELLTEFPNVVVLRTFSKAYGLAGLRVGYCIASPPVIEAVNKTALPFGVSGIAQAAAIASLADDSELQTRVHRLIAARAELESALQQQIPVIPSQANFVWLPLGSASADFAQQCELRGLAVRTFPGEGVRVTVAEPSANERLVDIASRFRIS